MELIELHEFKRKIKAKGFNLTSLSKEIGMTYNGLSRAVSKQTLTALKMKRIYEVARIRPVELFAFRFKEVDND